MRRGLGTEPHFLTRPFFSPSRRNCCRCNLDWPPTGPLLHLVNVCGRYHDHQSKARIDQPKQEKHTPEKAIGRQKTASEQGWRWWVRYGEPPHTCYKRLPHVDAGWTWLDSSLRVSFVAFFGLPAGRLSAPETFHRSVVRTRSAPRSKPTKSMTKSSRKLSVAAGGR